MKVDMRTTLEDTQQHRFMTLEEAGYEEDDSQPVYGGVFNPDQQCQGSVVEYVDWFYDGELEFSVM